jgi:Branched-chain amino acid ATP-binding cassette transporter
MQPLAHLDRAFETLRGSPVASGCMGVSVCRYKVFAIGVSAGLIAPGSRKIAVGSPAKVQADPKVIEA